MQLRARPVQQTLRARARNLAQANLRVHHLARTKRRQRHAGNAGAADLRLRLRHLRGGDGALDGSFDGSNDVAGSPSTARTTSPPRSVSAAPVAATVLATVSARRLAGSAARSFAIHSRGTPNASALARTTGSNSASSVGTHTRLVASRRPMDASRRPAINRAPPPPRAPPPSPARRREPRRRRVWRTIPTARRRARGNPRGRRRNCTRNRHPPGSSPRSPREIAVCPPTKSPRSTSRPSPPTRATWREDRT